MAKSHRRTVPESLYALRFRRDADVAGFRVLTRLGREVGFRADGRL